MFEISLSNQELYEKYGLIVSGIKRYYKVPLEGRVYSFERSIPKILYIDGFDISGKSWSEVYIQFVNHLISMYAINKEKLYNYKFTWSKAPVFTIKKETTNSFKVADNLYASNNFRSIHYIWAVQDLLKLFGINPKTCYLIVHSPSIGEPLEVKQQYLLVVKHQFKQFLKEEGYNEKTTEIILKNLNILNKYLVNMNSGADDFFLVDDLIKYDTLRYKVINAIKIENKFNPKQIETIKKVFTIYKQFLSSVLKATASTDENKLILLGEFN